MAKKKTNNRPSKKKNDSKFLLYVVIAAMVFSGVYYVFETQPGSETNTAMPAIKAYDAKQVANLSIVAQIVEIEPELVAKLNYPLSYESLRAIMNQSIPGLRKSELEVGGPRSDGTYLTGTYMLARYGFDELDENRTEALKDSLNVWVGKNSYVLLKACKAKLPFNYSGPGSDEAYMPCGLEAEVGDRYRIFLIEKSLDGYFEGTVAFAANRVDLGPDVPAKVVDVTDLIVEGKIEGDFDGSIANLTDDVMLTQPKYMVNETLSNQTAEELEELGVSVAGIENKTEISYERSSKEIEAILASQGLKYEKEDGYIGYMTSLETDTDELTAYLEKAGATEISYSRKGIVSVSPEVLMDGKLVDVPDNKALPARLSEETGKGDEVTIRLTTLQFGDQTYIIDASELV